MMLLKLVDASGIGYSELKGLDMYEFMLLYNELVQDAKRKKRNTK